MIYCYKVKMQFDEETNRQYWISVLKTSVDCYNFISDYIWTHKDLSLNQITVHRAVYHSARDRFPLMSSQMVCKVIKKVTANCKLLDQKYLHSSRRTIGDFYREATKNQWIKN